MIKLNFLKKTKNKLSVKHNILLVFATGVVCFISCNKKQSYKDIVAFEMDRGVKYDSLFNGLYFGMPMDDFYQHSFVMNQKGIFFQNNFNVEVIIYYDDVFSSPVDFVFFPEGSNHTIQKIKGTYVFRKWSPFTKQYNSGTLLEEVKEKLQEFYGGREFIKIKHPQKHWPYAYAKIDGNRKIILSRTFDDQKVEVYFENLEMTYKE